MFLMKDTLGQWWDINKICLPLLTRKGQLLSWEVIWGAFGIKMHMARVEKKASQQLRYGQHTNTYPHIALLLGKVRF